MYKEMLSPLNKNSSLSPSAPDAHPTPRAGPGLLCGWAAAVCCRSQQGPVVSVSSQPQVQGRLVGGSKSTTMGVLAPWNLVTILGKEDLCWLRVSMGQMPTVVDSGSCR